MASLISCTGLTNATRQTSTTYNTFMYLSLPVPSGRHLKVSLEDCVAAFVKEEVLEKEDAWSAASHSGTALASDTSYRNCPQCKVPRRATKRLTISRLPRILIIHLKRFSFKGPFSDKIDTDVQFPVYGLDLSAFVPQTQSTAADKLYSNGPTPSSSTAGTTYDLYGISQHFGTLSSGHCES